MYIVHFIDIDLWQVPGDAANLGLHQLQATFESIKVTHVQIDASSTKYGFSIEFLLKIRY